MDLRKLKTLIDLVAESDIAELEITEGEDTGTFLTNSVTFEAVSIAIPKNCAPGCCCAKRFKSGISLTQGGHHVAQKLITSARPRHCAIRCSSPAIFGKAVAKNDSIPGDVAVSERMARLAWGARRELCCQPK